MLSSGFCSLPLCLVTILAVETSELPTALVNVSEVLDSINFTKPVTLVPASFVNVILSPIFNCVLKFVPEPVTVALLFATVMLPVIVKLSP